MKLNRLKTICRYSFKIYKREFPSFLLPLLTITFTTLIVATALLITKGSEDYILNKNRELVGGDIKIESNNPIIIKDVETVIGKSISNTDTDIKTTKGLSFSSLVESNGEYSTVSVSVVDTFYPMYGEIIVNNKTYLYPESDEVYIDVNLSDKLNIQEGGTLTLNSNIYKVKGIVTSSPNALLAGFSFFPKIIISQEGFLRSNLDTALLRSEYSISISGITLEKDLYDDIEQRGRDASYDVDFAEKPSGGVVRGLASVNKFVIIAVLISCILASVNIYAGVLYLIKRLRKSLAVFAALGLDNKSLASIVTLTLIYTLLISISIGLVSSVFIYGGIQQYIVTTYNVVLPTASLYYIFSIAGLLVICTSLASFIPNLRGLLSLSPKILLTGSDEVTTFKTKKGLIITTIISFLPFLVITIYLLDDLLLGIYSVLVIIFIYISIAFLFFIFIFFAYKKRNNFNFLLRSILSIKYKDGLFGIVSVTSLYVALASIATLILLQSTLYNFLSNDISNKIPSLYLIDVQKSQIVNLKKVEPELNLFPNVGARIVSIDNINVQDELKKEKSKFTRELGREFNLSYTDKLRENEKLLEGKQLSAKEGEVSVDSEFANRAGIQLGSTIVFNIQGFDLVANVTSLRKTDRNSGLPFFYFLFNTKDLVDYPATFFGYAYFDEEDIKNISKILASEYPNISTVNTKEAGELLVSITSTLSLLVLVIAIPPVVLSIFLVTTLILLSFASKRKLTAQFMALGSTQSLINKLFYIESSFFTIISSVFAYITACTVTLLIAKYYLDIDSYTLYSHELLATLLASILLIIIITFLLSVLDKRSLKDLLSHEEN